MVKEAIILAGGFGTRLSHVLGNVPKPMAPVYGRPFICYILDKLIDHGITHVVLATGHLHEQIESYFANGYRGLTITISNETTPLFTGGAILQAAQYITGDHFIAINGDTLFDADLTQLSRFHLDHNADLSIVLRRVEDTSRYGSVVVGEDNAVIAFREKQQSQGAGLINGGIYAISKKWLLSLNMPQQFSFEKDILERDKVQCTVSRVTVILLTSVFLMTIIVLAVSLRTCSLKMSSSFLTATEYLIVISLATMSAIGLCGSGCPEY